MRSPRKFPSAVTTAAVVFSAALLALSACAGTKRAYHHTFDDLGKAARLFNDDARWGNTDKAAEFIAESDRAAFIRWRTALDRSVRFAEVHVGTAEYPRDSQEATVPVTWTFYRTTDLTQHEQSFTEHWVLKDLHWFVKFEPETWIPGSGTGAGAAAK